MSFSPTSSSSTNVPVNPYAGMLDVTCRVEVIVGSGSITVRDCLKLQRDSIVRLTQTAGSDLQVVVQGVPAATGEIVNGTKVRIGTARRLADERFKRPRRPLIRMDEEVR